MLFTVVWLESAQKELARIWVQAADRNSVTKASHLIDRWLRRSPLTVGRAHGTKSQFLVPPLQVIYTVSPDDCLVRVLQVGFVGGSHLTPSP
jgi:hypothetical protein